MNAHPLRLTIGTCWPAIICLLSLARAVTAQSLPPESELPKPQIVVPENQKLPPESALPNHVRIPRENGLPSESVLAAVVAAKPPDPNDPKVQDFIRVTDDSRDARVWLRLNAPEHSGRIRALTFDSSGTHLFSGGDDKVVHHWEWKTLPGESKPGWFHSETIRWQVRYGQVGRIQALACSGNVLLIAGYGAEGTRGEIIRYDFDKRQWLEPWTPYRPPQQVISGHRTTIVRLLAGPTQRSPVFSVDEWFGIQEWASNNDNNPGWESEWIRKPNTAKAFLWTVGASWNDDQTTVYLADQNNVPWQIAKISMNKAKTKEFLSPKIPPQNAKDVVQEWLTGLKAADANLRKFDDGVLVRALVASRPDNAKADVTLIEASANGSAIAAVEDFSPEIIDEFKKQKINLPDQSLTIWRDGKIAVKARAFFDGTNYGYQWIRWSDDGNILIACAQKQMTLAAGLKNGYRIQVWRYVSGKYKLDKAFDFESDSICLSGAVSREGTWIAHVHNDTIELTDLTGQNSNRNRLEAKTLSHPKSAVFSNSDYRWKLTFGTGSSIVFDPESLSLSQDDGVEWQPSTTRQSDWQLGDWKIKSERQGSSNSVNWNVEKAGKRIGTIDLRKLPDASIACVQWLSDPNGNPHSVAIVVDRIDENAISIFSLIPDEKQFLPRTRTYVGHEGAVTSLSISHDSKFLISAAQDSTIRIWPLSELQPNIDKSNAPRVLWGTNFRIENNRLIVDGLNEASTLFEFGVRDGDEIEKISFEVTEDFTTSVTVEKKTAQEIRDHLTQTDLLTESFQTPIAFYVRRNNVAQRAFQTPPNWRPLLSQVLGNDREWALWTAAGYYASSLNGNTLFGWHVNKGVKQSPDFFRADRFQAVLEKPEIIKQVLLQGSVESAVKIVDASIVRGFNRLANSIELQPIVRITNPTANSLIQGNGQVIEAEVEFPTGSAITPIKAFANGVPARLIHQQLDKTNQPGRTKLVARWEAAIPSDPQIKIQVSAANQSKLVGFDEVVVTNKIDEQTPRRHRLYVFAAGVGHYMSPILQLATPPSNARAIANEIANDESLKEIYEVVPLDIPEEQMTRRNWKSLLALQQEQMRGRVRPDDIILVFLSGHGILDETTKKYYYAPFDASDRQFVIGAFEDWLDIADIAPFADLPCRKIVILDTCHGGALIDSDKINQGTMASRSQSDFLLAAYRALQTDMIFTFTAAEGTEEAIEVKGRSLSLFTDMLVKALNAPVDKNQDGTFTWNELVEQVKQSVEKESESLKSVHHPAAGPADLLQFVRLPIQQMASQAVTPR